LERDAKFEPADAEEKVPIDPSVQVPWYTEDRKRSSASVLPSHYAQDDHDRPHNPVDNSKVNHLHNGYLEDDDWEEGFIPGEWPGDDTDEEWPEGRSWEPFGSSPTHKDTSNDQEVYENTDSSGYWVRFKHIACEWNPWCDSGKPQLGPETLEDGSQSHGSQTLDPDHQKIGFEYQDTPMPEANTDSPGYWEKFKDVACQWNPWCTPEPEPEPKPVYPEGPHHVNECEIFECEQGISLAKRGSESIGASLVAVATTFTKPSSTSSSSKRMLSTPFSLLC
jgi:hypothetical protein